MDLQAAKPAAPKSVLSSLETAAGIVGGTGVFAGLGAVVSASCCVLPVALSMAGIGGAWARNLPQSAYHRDDLVIAAAVLVALGWMLALLKRRRGACACPGSVRRGFTVVLLLVSTGFLILSLTAAWREPEALRLLALARRGG